MRNIGIIGSDIAGLHLALFLRKQGISVTLYSEQTPEQHRAGRLTGTGVLSARTAARDQFLFGTSWDAPWLSGLRVAVGATRVTGRFPDPWLSIDPRLYQAQRLEDFVREGGQLQIRTLQSGGVARLAEQHDLLVVATGKGVLPDLFEKLPDRSAPGPRRLVIAGQFAGFTRYNPGYLSMVMCPGLGEIFSAPSVNAQGPCTHLLIEAVPGGALEKLARYRYEDNPTAYEKLLLAHLRAYAPSIFNQIQPEKFALTSPLNFHQGPVTPTVRRGYRALGNGRFALALGDAFVTNAPITGQDANLASRCAWELGKAILFSEAFDEAFCQKTERYLLALTDPVIRWTQAMLDPPPQHLTELLMAAMHSPPLANVFAENFEHPARQWALLSSPERTRELIDHRGAAA